MHHISDAQYLHHLASIDFEPVFILGLHRSGTSILYKLLSQTRNYNIITAYHLISYDQLLSDYITSQDGINKQSLTKKLQTHSADRGIDRLKLNADFAEEYGFLLGKKSSKMHITKGNFSIFTELCKKVQYISQNHKPILLKNPYDFPNFLLIKKLYPNARFIFIHRHPIKTISSTINAVKLIFSKKNWYTAQLFRTYNKIYENPLLLRMTQFLFIYCSPLGLLYLTHQMKIATRFFIHNIEHLPNHDFINIRYEELCTDADGTLHSIQQFLGYQNDNKLNFQSQIHERQMVLDSDVEKFKRFIYGMLKQYFEYWGYLLDDI